MLYSPSAYRDATEFRTSEIRCNDTSRVPGWRQVRSRCFAFFKTLIRWSVSKEFGRNKEYLSLFFAISNVLNNISLWQKIYIFRGKIVSGTRNQGHENWPRLLIVRILLHRSSLWKVGYIPETFLVSHQQKILIKSNWLSHTEGLNTLGVASDGCNRLRSVLFVDAPDLGAVLLKMM